MEEIPEIPHSKKNKNRRNHFCCEPESFLKVHTIDTIGLSPYLSSCQHWQKRWAKSDMFQRRQVAVPSTICGFSFHNCDKKIRKKCQLSQISWCHASKIKGFQTQDNMPTSPCPNERPDHSPLAVGPRAGQGGRIHVQRPNRAREMWEKACYTGLFTKDSAHTQKSLLLLRVCLQVVFARSWKKKIQKHIWGQHATVSQIRELPLLLNFNCITPLFWRSKF